MVPVKHRLTSVRLGGVELGFHGKHVDFDWRPYDERRPEARAGYDRLEQDLRLRGMRNPIIVHRGHVLIGMRRVEILRKFLHPRTMLRAVEIEEDVAAWVSADIDRLQAFKRELYGDEDVDRWTA